MPKPAPEHGLLGGRVRLREAPEGLRATTDTVLLAAAVPAATGNLVLDLGSGVGAAALCLAWRVPGCRVIGVDSDAALIRLARRNARANGVADRVRFRVGAVAGRWPADLGSGCADHVMTNPPFLAPARAAARGSASRRGATVERGGAGLEAWVRHALALARPRGTLTIVHRADRLDDLLAALVGRAGSIVVFPLWPGRDDRPAKRVLVSARVGSRAPLRLVPGLVLHEPGGRYSDRAESVLRHGAPLELA